MLLFYSHAEAWYDAATPGYAVSNLVFALFYLVCCYNLFRASSVDPGFLPSLDNEDQLKEVGSVRRLTNVNTSEAF
jgi:hypothetical protein